MPDPSPSYIERQIDLAQAEAELSGVKALPFQVVMQLLSEFPGSWLQQAVVQGVLCDAMARAEAKRVERMMRQTVAELN